MIHELKICFENTFIHINIKKILKSKKKKIWKREEKITHVI